MPQRRLGNAITGVCIGLAAGGGALGATPASESIGKDARDVYEAVLDGSLGAEKGDQLINERLSPAPSPDDADYADCARDITLRPGQSASRQAESLDGVTFKRGGLKLVDGDQWVAGDRGLEASVRQGKFNPADLDRAFAHSLISFSQVAFSVDGQDALVKFSSVCGSLCGTGSTLRLHRVGSRWTIVKRCGGWIS